MKTSQIISSIVAIAAVTFAAVSGAQDQALGKFLATEVELGRSKIQPCEPLTAKLILRNKSEDTQSVTSTWSTALLIRRDAETDWLPVSYPGPQAAPPIPTTRTFKTRESLTVFFDISSLVALTDAEENHILRSPGIYWIKGMFAGLESAPCRLEVLDLPKNEVKSFDEISKLKLYRYFSPTSANLYLAAVGVKKPADELQQFLNDFPKSHYAPWCELGLLLVKRSQAASDAKYMKS